MPILILALAALICACDGWPLWRQKRRRELAVFGVLIGAAVCVGVCRELGLPAPLDTLGRWLHPVGRIIFRGY